MAGSATKPSEHKQSHLDAGDASAGFVEELERRCVENAAGEDLTGDSAAGVGKGQALPPLAEACKARVVLDRVADKWSLYVVAALEPGELRFTELKRRIDGVSQRMLTVTLRGLERDGIVKRTVHNAMPPNIAYGLTSLGRTLCAAITPLIAWTTANLARIDEARLDYDRRGRPGGGAEPD